MSHYIRCCPRQKSQMIEYFDVRHDEIICWLIAETIFFFSTRECHASIVLVGFPRILARLFVRLRTLSVGIYYAAWYVALFAKKRFRENFRIDTACFSTRERLYSLLFSPLYNNDSFSNPSLSFVILAFKSIDFDLCSSRINYVNPIAISFLCETCSSKETRISEQLYR